MNVYFHCPAAIIYHEIMMATVIWLLVSCRMASHHPSLFGDGLYVRASVMDNAFMGERGRGLSPINFAEIYAPVAISVV